MMNTATVMENGTLDMANPLLRDLMAWWPLTTDNATGGTHRRLVDISPYKAHGKKGVAGLASTAQGTRLSNNLGESGIAVPWKENLSTSKNDAGGLLVPAVSSRQWTISHWIHAQVDGGYNIIIYDAYNSSPTLCEYRLRMNRYYDTEAGQAYYKPYVSWKDGTGWDTAEMNKPLYINDLKKGWVHIAATINLISDVPPSRVCFYLDGVIQPTTIDPAGGQFWDAVIPSRCPYERKIGWSFYSSQMANSCWMRDLILWKRELTPQEVCCIHASGGNLRKMVSLNA